MPQIRLQRLNPIGFLPFEIYSSLVPLLEEIQVLVNVLSFELKVFLILGLAPCADNAVRLYLLQMLQEHSEFFDIFDVILHIPFHAVDVAENIFEVKTYILLVFDMNVVLEFESGNGLHGVVRRSEVAHGTVLGRLGQEHGRLDFLHLRI